MKVILICTQNDYSRHMDRIPQLCMFLTKKESLKDIDLVLINVICKSTISNDSNQGNVMLQSCMNIISIVSQFSSFKHDLIESENDEVLKLKTAIEIGKYSLPSVDHKVVFITNDDNLKTSIEDLSADYGIHCISSGDLS